MASQKLLSYLRVAEADLRNTERKSFKNRPYSDPAFSRIQSERQIRGGEYMLADNILREPHPKTQSISWNALEHAAIPFEYRPGINPRLVETESKLLAKPAVPRCYTRDIINANEIVVPYDTVIFDQPLGDEADLHFLNKKFVRRKGVQQKLVTTTYFDDYVAPPLIFGVKEPAIGNRLLEARDSRTY